MTLSSQFGGLPINEGEETAVHRTAENYDIMHGTHGTASDDGTALTEILPSAQHGRSVFPGVSDAQRAYYSATDLLDQQAAKEGRETSSLDVSKQGWSWARQSVASHRNAGRAGHTDPNSPPPRPMVHHVVPEGSLGTDPVLNRQGGLQQMTSSKLRVVDTEWIPAPRGSSPGIQGTLPNENWNKWPATDRDFGGKVVENNYTPIQPKASDLYAPPPKSRFTPVSNKEMPGQRKLPLDGPPARREGIPGPVVTAPRARRR